MNNSKVGYPDSIFVAERKDLEELICRICLNVFDDPHQCSNGHCFCKQCVLTALAKKTECPLCKIYLHNSNLVRNLSAKTCVDNLATKCPSSLDAVLLTTVGLTPATEHTSKKARKRSCTWSGKLCDRNRHFEEDCEFRILTCSHSECGKQMERMFMPEHIRSCEYAPSTCAVCQEDFPKMSMNEQWLSRGDVCWIVAISPRD